MLAYDNIVLVDEDNQVLGTVPKKDVHSFNTPLHRGFSVFVFNPEGELLLQQRSRKKITWPLVWSNSCCGHPALEESNESAARRRLRDELQLKVNYLQEISPYRYRFTKDGMTENEICPILVALADGLPHANSDEVEAVEWIPWSDFILDIKSGRAVYSPWCKEEAALLSDSLLFAEWWRSYVGLDLPGVR